jgi:hypothetical protein
VVADTPDRVVLGRDLRVVALCALGLLAVYQLLFMADLAPGGEGIGLDYAYFMPSFLSGHFHFVANGPFSVPWFTPSECGGLPFLPNPQVMYYSLPQLLVLLLEPVLAFRVFYLITVLVGFVGMAGLLRGPLGTSLPGALLGALVFALNGFFFERMLVGHMAYASIALLPAWAWILLAGSSDTPWWRRALRVLVAGGVPALMIFGGSAGSMVPFGLALVGILLVHALRRGSSWGPWLGLAGSGMFGLCLAALKVLPTVAFLRQFPRDFYDVAGVPGLGKALVLVLHSLFLGGAVAAPYSHLSGYAFGLDQYELDYSVSVVPLVLLAALAVRSLRRPAAEPPAASPWGRRALVAALAGLLLLPVALNLHWAPWTAILERTPYVRNSSLLLRWITIDIPILAVLAALALDALAPRARSRLWLAAVAAVVVLGQQALAAASIELSPRYDPRPMSAAHAAARQEGTVVPIAVLGRMVDAAGHTVAPLHRDDLMLHGASQILCYEPLFGYDLEHLDVRGLRLDAVTAEYDGRLNMRDPACMLYPEHNECGTDGRFATGRLAELQAFAAYRAIPFGAPPSHSVALYTSLAAWAALLAALTALLGLGLWRWRARRD